MTTDNPSLRRAQRADLSAINRVISAAVMSWDLPERVKRLSLSTYHYTELDMAHLQMVVAEERTGTIIGVAAWEPAEPKDMPAAQSALLLHGLYVTPSHHHRGMGTVLFRCAEQAAREQHYDGLLVKAQEDAAGFFLAMGMERLAAEDQRRHYAHRYWMNIHPHP